MPEMDTLSRDVFDGLQRLVSRLESRGDVEGAMRQLGSLVRMYEVLSRYANQTENAEDSQILAAGAVANALKVDSDLNVRDEDELKEERLAYEHVRDLFEQAYQRKSLGGVTWSIHEISRALKKASNFYLPGPEGRANFRRFLQLALRDLERTDFSPRLGK
ncbi:hypothetical protein [Burkholderia pseudomallei]|uniref:hypothetical protein n=1 Tax=Burkholderia pseudomallei TaxID=28450 RepID=UPI0013007AC3|nr:hypothetical protein [Burkholderia pseudomallei]QGT03295.1 hypothetical protein D286_02165 [Burkholderia pseudomallei]